MKKLRHLLKIFFFNCVLTIKYKCKLSDIIILATTAKSGTHYLKFLIFNYINLIQNIENKPISPKIMNQSMPNDWHNTYLKLSGINEPSQLIKNTINFKDISRTHIHYIDIMSQSKIIHVYRNPLDYCVSLYFYKYVNQNNHKNVKINSPYDVFKNDFDNYLNTYLSYREVSRKKTDNLLRLRYENLIRNPEMTLSTIIRWLGLRPNNKLIKKSISYSSKDILREFEKSDPIHPNRKNLKNSFIRSGEIGEWKNFFSKEQYNEIFLYLEKYEIGPNDFTLE